jgi:hypothetical protein
MDNRKTSSQVLKIAGLTRAKRSEIWEEVVVVEKSSEGKREKKGD